MDYKRITSGFIIGLALCVILLSPSNIITGILFMIVAIYAMKEYLNAISKVCKPVRWVAYASCAIVGTINLIPDMYITKFLLLSIPTLLIILFCHVIGTDMKISFKDIAYTFFGICYVSVFLMFLTLIDKAESGKFLLGYVFISAWGTDTMAYVIGRKYGKHKFSKVSPKKSIEGCIGGTLGALAISLIYTLIVNQVCMLGFSYLRMSLITIVLSLIGQIGDFSASTIKRYVDIKDYSNLIPGHGGMLDRIDSVLFIAPFAYLLLVI